MQSQGRGLGALLQRALQRGFLRLQLGHPVLHARLIHPVLDGCQNAPDLLVDLAEVAAGLFPGGIRAGGFRIEGAPVVLDEGCNQLRVQQAVAQACQNAVLDHFALDRGAVGANRLALVAGPGAAVAGLVDQSIARPAATADQQTRKQIIGPPRILGPGIPALDAGRVHILADGGLPRLDPLPQRIVDDLQMGDRLIDQPLYVVQP
ncbi:MAG: hypothetical protein VR71_18550 [Roseovarius sp. BRH_c41]|nr:MAG: hypothetical protein VR71_18550 [Roseovarius sp. BRH_c41]